MLVRRGCRFLSFTLIHFEIAASESTFTYFALLINIVGLYTVRKGGHYECYLGTG